MVTILITGGAGFIGSHLAKVLLASDVQVRILDNLSSGARENIPHHKNCQFIEGDITDEATVRKAMDGCSHVVHLAAQVSVPASIEHPDATFRANVVGTELLLKTARAQNLAGWFIFASSAAVYGPLEKQRVQETDAVGATLKSPYASSKAMNEIQAKMYKDLYGINTLGLRFFNVYGAGQTADSPYSAVLARVVHSVRTGELLTIFGDGLQTRDFVSISDVALAVKLLLQRHPKAPTPPVVNVGSGTSVTLLDAIRVVVNLLKVNPRVEYRAARAGDIRHSCSDIQALKTLLPDWAPQTLQNGLRQWLLG